MKYLFRCDEHGPIEIHAPIAEGPPSEVFCDSCGIGATRIYEVPPTHYHGQGFHSTDYFSGNAGTGTRADQLNKVWSNHFGETPPEPAKVPTNLKEKY